jgi:DNA-binding IscR family transcriptional regulator
MGQVVRHFDGIIAPIECVSAYSYQRCSQEPVCRFRRIFLEVRNSVAKLMDSAAMALAEVARGLPVKGSEVFVDSFASGAGI